MKNWYRSKTMWLNIAIFLGMVAAGLIEFLPMLEGAIPLVFYKWTLFVASMANIWLRRVTRTGIL